jgi:hypothetical protein
MWKAMIITNKSDKLWHIGNKQIHSLALMKSSYLTTLILRTALNKTHNTFRTLQTIPFILGRQQLYNRTHSQKKYITCSRANRLALNSLQSNFKCWDLLEAVSLDLFPSEELFFFKPSPSGIDRSPFPDLFHEHTKITFYLVAHTCSIRNSKTQ